MHAQSWDRYLELRETSPGKADRHLSNTLGQQGHFSMAIKDPDTGESLADHDSL